uniref:Diacylglycerol kinase n=1 Tax=Trichuris muris TaxID=70415 RepID=A0A5S6QKZ7_TRIMR
MGQNAPYPCALFCQAGCRLFVVNRKALVVVFAVVPACKLLRPKGKVGTSGDVAEKPRSDLLFGNWPANEETIKASGSSNGRWRQLSSKEFEKLYQYLLYRSKKLKDVFKEFDEGGQLAPYKVNGEAIDFDGFKALLDFYLDSDVPKDLCLHLFNTFVKEPVIEESALPSAPAAGASKLRRYKSHDRQTSQERAATSSECLLEGSTSARLKDILCYFSLLENGSPEEKLEYTFHLYDEDSNGYLDGKEIECIMDQMMSVAVHLSWDTVELKPILREMLLEIDYDADGTVSLEEWKRGGLTTIPLLVLLGIDAQRVHEDGTHVWALKHFSKPSYCNHCMKHLVSFSGKQGLSCIFCKHTVHERCAKFALNNCISTYSKSKKDTTVMVHHWIESNCSDYCLRCKKRIKTLEGKRCRWCKSEVHICCLKGMDSKCNLGKLAYHILPPTAIVPTVLATERRKVNGKQASSAPAASNGPFSPSMKSFDIEVPPNCRPLLVFLNPKSGGKQGTRLYRKLQYLLNPRQVFLLDENGPYEGLKMFQQVRDCNILCCGGDGTVNWVLDAMDQVFDPEFRPPVAVLPLGTGNDLSRCLNWGGGFAGKTGKDLIKVLKNIERSTIVTLDRWMINVVEQDNSEKGDAVPNNIVTNYFSIGVDASIAHRFHTMREKYPEKFNSRMKNKLWYLEFATSESFQATCKNLHEFVEINCDGLPLNLATGPPLEGVAFLNIPSIYGGSNLWGSKPKESRSKRNCLRLSPSDDAFSTSCDLKMTVQDMGDKKIEVVGIQSVISMGQVKAGLRTSARRLAQCSSAVISTRKRFPMQIDGEPWLQQPCTISIMHKNQVQMLQASKKHRSDLWHCINQDCSKT